MTVEADVGADGQHHLVRAQAEGGRIDLVVLQALADLVCGSWSSSPPRLPDGSECDMRADESIRLIVDFPVVERARALRVEVSMPPLGRRPVTEVVART